MQIRACPHESATEVFKALSDATRVRVLGLLLQAGDEVCVCEVESCLEITQSRASRALTALKRAGLIVDRRDGAWAYYAVTPRPTGLVRSVLNGIRATLAEDPVVQADVQTLRGDCC